MFRSLLVAAVAVVGLGGVAQAKEPTTRRNTMKTIERHDSRTLFGKIIMAGFVFWNVLMAKVLWNVWNIDGAVFAQIFLWSLSSLVLGTFVYWTRGSKIIEIVDENKRDERRELSTSEQKFGQTVVAILCLLLDHYGFGAI